MLATWKTVRVFISSTFRDMQAERDHLVRFVFPRLYEELLPRRIHLVDVDLRWGVTSEQDASEVCREVINECRPRFLCMLGGRYGWVPPGKTRSITADEVHYGVLDRTLPDRGFAYFYFRDDAATAAMVETTPGELREPQGGDNQNKLAELKQAIIAAGLKPFKYPAQWDNESRRLTDLRKFGDRVYDDLLGSMKSDPELRDLFVTDTAAQLDEFAEENAAMEAFVEERSERFVLGSRGAVMEELLAHASATGGNGYVCLTGAPGSGKSALLAHLSQHPNLNNQPSTLLIRHFVGASPGSTDVRRTLRRLCHEMKAGCPDITADIPDDPETLRVALPDFLWQACARQRVVILLDAVNQFDPASHSGELHWLPTELPDNARVILSALDGPALEELRRRPHKACEIELKPLTADDGEAIIEQFRERYRKKFETDQRAALLAKTDAGTPLYLLAALEELRTLGTYEEITQRIGELPPTTRELFAWILERLENDDGFRDAIGRRVGRELVSRFAALLGASRYGLSQRELAELLDAGDPQGNVAALLHLLRPYLMRRGELLDFYHGQFRTAAEEAWLNTDAQRQAAHAHLADYFREQAAPSGNGTWNGTPRGFRELPHHVLRANRCDESFALARDEAFLIAQRNSFPREPDLPLQTVRLALQAAQHIDEPCRMAEFCLSHAMRVAEANKESPLNALRAGNLHRAWGLADLCDAEHRVLWHLLLAAELKETSQTQQARATLDRLVKVEAPRLLREKCAADLLLLCVKVDRQAFRSAQEMFLGDEVRADLCRRLAGRGCIDEALEAAQQIESLSSRALLLAVLAAAQAHTGDNPGAQSTLSTALSLVDQIWASDDQIRTLRSIAVALWPAGPFRSALVHFTCVKNHFWEELLRAVTSAIAGDAESAETTLSGIRGFARHARGDGSTELRSAVAVVHGLIGDYATAEMLIREPAYELGAIAAAQAQLGDYASAVSTANKIREADTLERARTLCLVGVAQAESGDLPGGQDTLRAVFRTAQELHQGVYWRDILEKLAIAQFDAGDSDAAQATLAALQPGTPGTPEEEHGRKRAVSRAQAHGGLYTAALQTAQRIGDSSGRWAALQEIARAQARAGEVAAALQTAQRIGDSSRRWAALQEIAGAQAGEGHLAAALETARGTGGEDATAEALWIIAAAQAQAGDAREAIATMAESLQSSRSVETSRYREPTLRAIEQAAKWLEVSLQQQPATTRFDQRETTNPTTGVSDAREGASAQDWREYVSSTLELSAELSNASRAESVRNRPEACKRAETLCAMAVLQLGAGDREAARTILSGARAIADRIDHLDFDPATRSKVSTLIGVASVQARAGDNEAAKETLLAARSVAEYIEKSELAEPAIRDVALGLAGVSAFAEALHTAQQIERQGGRDLALRDVAEVQAERGDYSEALQTGATIQDVNIRSSGVASVAETQARRGLGDAALRTTAGILAGHHEHLPRIAEALLAAGDANNFKRLLIPCSYYLDAAYKVCALLAQLHPEQAGAIGEVVKGQSSDQMAEATGQP